MNITNEPASILPSGLTRQYSDLDLSLNIHPAYGDAIPLYDLDALRQSIRLILLTEPGERPFKPNFGCGLRRHLFEPSTPATVARIRETIYDALDKYEDRIKLVAIDVKDLSDKNAYDVEIQAEVKNYNAEVDVRFSLRRLR